MQGYLRLPHTQYPTSVKEKDGFNQTASRTEASEFYGRCILLTWFRKNEKLEERTSEYFVSGINDTMVL
jgi:hypothetical protein